MKVRLFMNSFLLKIVILFVIPITTLAGNTPESSEGEEFENQVIVRKRISRKQTFLLTLENKNRLKKRRTQSFNLDYQYKLNKYFSTFLTYKRKYGERFDEDWINPSTGVWTWNETNTRGVNHGELGLISRMKLSFLPGKSWIGQLNVRLSHNFFNSQKSLILAPELKYFHFKNGKPFMTWFLKHEMSKAMNFANDEFFRSYTYIGSLYHANKNVAIGPFIGVTSYKWFSTSWFENKVSKSYETENTSTLVGVIVSTRI
ncbi:MAG: hypothetical protein KC493_08930 [Bacteriovoracaceae bacterium]|nr:hypothetical protein [Bacteriovoracaceae bacterium]